MGNQIRANTENAGSKIGDCKSFGAFAKVLGALMVVFVHFIV
jgi:hypothetical protein